MLSCTSKECEFALGLLIEKKVCDSEKMPDGKLKIVSRRMKRDVEKSLIRSKSGKKGAEAKKKHQQKDSNILNFASAKAKQNPDIDYVIENDIEFNSLEGAGNFSFDSKTVLPVFTLEAAEMNQFTHTKSRNTDFIKNQWETFLTERMNDPPEKKIQYRKIQDLTTYFLNWNRNKFPTNGTHKRDYGKDGISKETIGTSGGFGKF
jgi:hypothetical protein